MDIEKANAEATERMMEARPVLVGLGKARDVIPGMRDKLAAARRPAHHLGSGLRADARRDYRGPDF
jgi:hypothetical protein